MLVDLILELVRISTLYLLDKVLWYFIQLSIQIQVYQFGVQPSKSIQWEDFSRDQEKGQQLAGLCPAVQGEGGLSLLDLAPWQDTSCAPEAHLCHHDRRG